MIANFGKQHSPSVIVLAFALVVFCFGNAFAQKASKLDIEQWRDVLRNVKTELKDRYYDRTFQGIDIEERFKVADEKMKRAESMGQLVGTVAHVLLELNDPHTFFVPPFRTAHVEYGWRMRVVGNDCYVGAVRPGSDAEAKGLRPGDRVLSIDGKPLDRTKVWLAGYLYYTLRPHTTVSLVVEKPDSRQQEMVIKAKLSRGRQIITYAERREWDLEAEEDFHWTRNRLHQLSEDVLIWKMSRFSFAEYGLEQYLSRLKKCRALILDLRGNSRGYFIEHFAGYFFDSNIKLADRRGRKELEPMLARSQKDKVFKGQLVVLIDGESASAAEIFARVVQLEKRGVVIGDLSAGAVRQSRYYELQVGAMKILDFGINATEADLIMADGKSLEHVGVMPDELLLPTVQDMSAGLDPVLARAASLVGIKLDPKTAGAVFPVEWRTRY